jgi:predicted DNA-binding ribbon-helix-helix protein
MTRTSIALTGPQIHYLDAEARRDGITVADLIRRIIDGHRNRECLEQAKRTQMKRLASTGPSA